MGKAVVFTDLQVAVLPDCYRRIAPRSGLTVQSFIDVGVGVIDRDYRGNVGVILFNFGVVDFAVRMRDKIAQLICEQISSPSLV
ncbi:DUT protein, partial [Amia calva]|nr:DUT protein [Amia calva]